MKKSHYFVSHCVVLVVAGHMLIGGHAFAASISFNGATNDDITEDTNWSSGSAPAFGGPITDRLNFLADTTYTVAQGTSTINSGGGESRSLSIDGGGTLTVSGGTINIATSSNTPVFIANGSGDSGHLVISGGDVVVGDSGDQDIIMNFGGSGLTSSFTINSGSITLDEFKDNTAAASSVTYNFNGGTTAVRRVRTDAGSPMTVNFDGGSIVQNTSASASSPTFAAGNTTANILAGGLIFDTNGFDGFLNSVLNDGGGAGGVTKKGAGTLRLDSFGGDSTYTGPTQVEAGVLRLTGSFIGNSATTIDAGATLSGTGSTNGAVSLDGGSVNAQNLLSVNNPLEVGSLAATGLGGTLVAEFDSDADTIDLVNVTGNLDLSNLDVSFADLGASSLAGASYIFATYGSLTGTQFANVTGLPANFEIDYAFGGNNIALVNLIPEPATFVLGFLGLFATGVFRRRQE